ncbi:MAG: hypothetical protein A3A62_00675 [Candidatus Blackburnbacteria bacterium RIFCSPLOWO2_01_FULL_44_43]|nr:MAG: hypothetical protein A3A62_00675 [Candidatus Blackburnbacteria bacterium RIFCSPLOWO2_01_FULL_44_43]
MKIGQDMLTLCLVVAITMVATTTVSAKPVDMEPAAYKALFAQNLKQINPTLREREQNSKAPTATPATVGTPQVPTSTPTVQPTPRPATTTPNPTRNEESHNEQANASGQAGPATVRTPTSAVQPSNPTASITATATASPTRTPTVTATLPPWSSTTPRLDLIPTKTQVAQGECFDAQILFRTFGRPRVTAGSFKLSLDTTQVYLNKGKSGEAIVEAQKLEINGSIETWRIAAIDWYMDAYDGELAGILVFCTTETATSFSITITESGVNWWPASGQQVFKTPNTSLVLSVVTNSAVTNTNTPTPTVAATASVAPTKTSTSTATPSPTQSRTPTATPPATPSPTATTTASPTRTSTAVATSTPN